MTPLPEAILERIEAHFSAEYVGINMMSTRRAAEELGSAQRIREQLALMQQSIGEVSEDPARTFPTCQRMLEIGSGYGVLQAEALVQGAGAFGIEPDWPDCSISQAVLAHYGFQPARISQAVGECLPFANDAFDCVCSFMVLEHVQDMQRVLYEATRVLKSGGYLHLVAPNYGSIWEGHYNILWIPHSPRWLAKLYVRLLGRRPEFVDSLQFVTPGKLRRIVRTLPLEVKSWGVEVWDHRLDTLDFTAWSEAEHLKTMVRWARRLGAVDTVRWLGRRLDFFTPIILTAQKVGSI